MHRVFLATALVTALAIPSASHADQFVLFDETFTFTKEDADNSKPSKSHYYVKGDKLNKDRPRDWTAPVDYRNGTVHIRTEVIEKPAGGEPTTWTLCYIPNKGQGNGYGCTGTDLYRETGVYEKDVSMKSFWQNDAIVWTEGIKQMDLVIKDNSGGSGHAHKRKDREKFFPTKMRITMIQVSAGSKYDPSLVPNLPREDDKKAKPREGQAPAEKKAEACCGIEEPVASPRDRTAARSSIQFSNVAGKHRLFMRETEVRANVARLAAVLPVTARSMSTPCNPIEEG
jgi:hypothetical protein